MGFSNTIYAEAIEQKRVLRQKNEQLRDALKSQLYNDVPRIKEIDTELATLGMEITMATFSGNKDKLDALKDRCISLKTEKEKLTPKGYDIPYSCDKCKDSGVIDGKPCDCIKVAAKKLQYAKLSSVAPFDECSIDSFSLEYYSDKSDSAISPRLRMEKNLAYIKKYIEKFPNYENLLLVGATGLGKTHLSIAIANAVIEKGYGVFYSSAEHLISKLQKEKFGKSDGETNYNDAALECDLLILDDLGTEFNTQFSKSIIYDIVNSRILTKKPTIINTNLFMPEIKEMYSPRIASRFIGEYTSLLFDGVDIRQIRNSQKQKATE